MRLIRKLHSQNFLIPFKAQKHKKLFYHYFIPEKIIKLAMWIPRAFLNEYFKVRYWLLVVWDMQYCSMHRKFQIMKCVANFRTMQIVFSFLNFNVLMQSWIFSVDWSYFKIHTLKIQILNISKHKTSGLTLDF